MTRQTLALGAAVVVATLTAFGLALASGSGDANQAAESPAASTAKVEEGTLAKTVSLAGTLTRRAQADGSPYPVINQAHGIYTQLPGAGDRLACGEVAYRVDDHPVLLLCGPIPGYRGLSVGDHGNDVRQLNAGLHALGFDHRAAISSRDRAFTWKTAAALKGLRRAKGLHVKGSLDLDDAVFLPRSIRLAKVTGQLGGVARAGTPVAQATSDALEVQVNLEASQQGEIKRGDRAQITLPGNRSVKGSVDRLGRVARSVGKDAGPGTATIPASIRLDQPGTVRGLDQAPVQVDVTTDGVHHALSVPVIALVGKSGGGFAVEVVRRGGRRELIAVKVGLFDDTAGRVQVAGALRVGDDVVVPSL